MDKVDLKKELKALYNPSTKEVTIIDVPDMNFLMIDGQGSPASQTYMEAIQTLFPLAYALKFTIKKGRGIDYGVLPLEGLWWMDDMNQFSVERKDEWKWTSMIMQPKYPEGKAPPKSCILDPSQPKQPTSRKSLLPSKTAGTS